MKNKLFPVLLLIGVVSLGLLSSKAYSLPACVGGEAGTGNPYVDDVNSCNDDVVRGGSSSCVVINSSLNNFRGCCGYGQAQYVDKYWWDCTDPYGGPPDGTADCEIDLWEWEYDPECVPS